VRIRDRLDRLEVAAKGDDAIKPYCWAWAWQSDEEALAECNKGREQPLTADQVTWIRTRGAVSNPASGERA